MLTEYIYNLYVNFLFIVEYILSVKKYLYIYGGKVVFLFGFWATLNNY